MKKKIRVYKNIIKNTTRHILYKDYKGKDKLPNNKIIINKYKFRLIYFFIIKATFLAN